MRGIRHDNHDLIKYHLMKNINIIYVLCIVKKEARATYVNVVLSTVNTFSNLPVVFKWS